MLCKQTDKTIASSGKMAVHDNQTYCLFLAFSLIGILFHGCLSASPRIIDEQILWKAGDLGVSYYRIPIITALPDGSLLALSEGRKHSSSDSGPKFLAVRRSKDSGKTWSETSFIEDDKEARDGLNLGCVLVDEQTGMVFVMYSFCYHDCAYHTTYLIRSKDNGLNWTSRRNISDQIGSFAFAPGPGYGIQKKLDPWKGRLIVCGHSGGKTEGMYCVTSDDHGETWKVSATLPRENSLDPGECQIVERDDGIVLMTARNRLHDKCRCRIMATSYDGCETFAHSDIYFDETLVDPTVAASLLSYRSFVFFSNPANPMFRINMTLRWSADNGEHWKGALGIWQGPSGYSCLTAIPNGQTNETIIGLLYEKGHVVYYESIAFVRIAL